jgi:hypothetical protein
MKVRILVSCAIFFFAIGASTAFAAQQWDCKYHFVVASGNSSDISDTLIENNAASLSGFLDDLSNTREQYTIIQNSPIG